MWMASSRSTRAPASSRAAERSKPWVFCRVVTTVRPKRGRSSKQSSTSPSEATCPTTVMAGGGSSAARTAAASFPRGARTVRCKGVVARLTTAAGVSGGRPFSNSFRQVFSSRERPIKKTSVPSCRAAAAQSTGSSPVRLAAV